MNRVFVALAVVIGAASPVAAQAPGAELPLPAFLEKRVPEELAVEGHVLSRDNLTLKVESAGPIFVVSLVDLNTGRVAASTKIDQLPLDREAAVASVTHVAADLITQITGREPPPPQPPPVVIDDRAERAARAAREATELEYKKQAIRFDDSYNADPSAVLSRGWTAYRGAVNQELTTDQFYKLVGHPELATAFYERRAVGVIAIVVGVGVTIGAFAYLGSQTNINCPDGDPNFQACLDAHEKAFSDAETTTLLLAAVSAGIVVAGIHFIRHSHAVSETEVKKMADQYNNGIRQNLGLPVVERHWFHDVHVAPYMTHGEGGLALGARF